MEYSGNDDIFAEVRKHTESSDKYKAENCTVLEAVEEIIMKTKGVFQGIPSPVEYFSCIMSTLASSNERQRSLLYLLQLILPSVSENVKRLKCNDCLDILLNSYKSRENDIEPSALRSLITCIGEILMAQELSQELWDSSVVKRSFSLILSSSMYESGKVRRCAQDITFQIMELHYNSNFHMSSRHLIRQLDVLNKEFNEDDYHDVVNYLMLVARVILVVHHDFYPNLLQLLLKLRQHQCPQIDHRALRPIELLLESNRYLSPDLMTTTYTQLQAVGTPATGNDKDATEYVTVLSLLCRALMQVDPETYTEMLVTITRVTLAFFLNPNAALHKGISVFLIRYYPMLSDFTFPASIVQQIIGLYLETLQFKYQHAWTYILPSISGMVRLFGPQFPHMFDDLLQQLLAIYDSSVKGDAAFQMIITKTLGYCIEALGPDVFIQSVPIVDPQSGLPLDGHYFLFQLISDHVKHAQSHLQFFFEELIPIAKACNNAASQATNPALKRRYLTYVTDIWNMFPSFCVRAVDTATTLPTFIKNLLAAMTDSRYRELSIIVSKGLTLLIRSNQMALEQANEEEGNESGYGRGGMQKEESEQESESESESEEEIQESKIRDEDLGEEILPFLEILKTTRAARFSREVAAANLEALLPLCENLLLTLLSLYEKWHGDFSTEIPRFSGIGPGGDNASVQVIRCALETVFSVSSADLVSKMLKQVLGKLLAAFTNENPEENEQCIGQSIILTGLLSTVIRYVQENELMIILRCLRPHLNDDHVPILQKRVYFCLLCICKYHASLLVSNMLEDMHTMLMETILTISVVSKKYRLKCLLYLCRQFDATNPSHIQFIVSVLPEVVLCIKDPSKKIRAICLAIVTRFSDIMSQSSLLYKREDGSDGQASLSDFIGYLTTCLAAHSTHMQASGILALAAVLRRHKTNPATQEVVLNVLHCVYELLRTGNKELVKSGLRYVRTSCRLLEEDMLRSELDMIMTVVMATSSDNKNKFRTTIRSILEVLLRRVGEEEVRQRMPEEDLPLLTNILRMERRKENAKNRAEEAEETNKQSRTRFIREDEDPLDLLNVEDVTRGVRTRKEEQESDTEIEMDENGRFIVREDEESEEEDSRMAKRKRNAPNEEADEDEKDGNGSKQGARRVGKFQRRQQGKSIREANEDGSRFRSTKAKGDMKKGNVDPYAYVALDSRMLSRKKKSQTLGKFQNLIGAAKRGAQDGMSKRRRHN